MIETARTHIEVMAKEHALGLLRYHLENREHLAPWQPQYSEDYFTLENWHRLCTSSVLAFESGSEVRLVALHKETNEVVGVCNFTGISRGAFQACFLGYSVAKKYEGNGYMTEILEVSLDYMFDVVGLNRVMATHMPRNVASEKVLIKLGFEKEGFARKYLKIAGRWEDHILTSKLNEKL